MRAGDELRRELADITPHEAAYVRLYIKALKRHRPDLCQYFIRRSRRELAA